MSSHAAQLPRHLLGIYCQELLMAKTSALLQLYHCNHVFNERFDAENPPPGAQHAHG